MKAIKKFLKRIWLNRSEIVKITASLVGVLYTLWGFVSLYSPLEGTFDNSVSGWSKLLYGFIVLVVLTILCGIVSAIHCLRSKTTTVLTSNSNFKVYVKYGDMYSPEVVEKGYSGRINLVIPVNRCFDTIVNDSLVSHCTQHGKVMQKLYDDKIFTIASLDAAFSQSLANAHVEKHLSSADKPEGKLERYECGNIAEVYISPKLTYFFLALSKFDSNLKASTTKAEFAKAVQELIEFSNDRGQGYPVVLPLMGTGLSRTNIPPTEILKYLVSAFRINKDVINCDFHIVVWDGLKDTVAIKGL